MEPRFVVKIEARKGENRWVASSDHWFGVCFSGRTALEAVGKLCIHFAKQLGLEVALYGHEGTRSIAHESPMDNHARGLALAECEALGSKPRKSSDKEKLKKASE